MKQTRVIIAICLAFYTASAQEDWAPPAQELEPVEDALTYHSPDYQVRLRDVLFAKAPKDSVCQFLRKPSFHPESLLTIWHNDSNYIAQVLHPNMNIWYYKGDLPTLQVSATEKELPDELAKRVSSLWHTMLLRTKFQRRNHALDGISYTFLGTVPGYSEITAQSRNPEKGTKPDMLAEIGLHLMNYVMVPPDEEKNIEAQIGDLIDKLENSLR